MSYTPGFDCADCHCNVKQLREYHYKIKSEIWLKVAKSNEFLCIGCLEKRLGRRITKEDFTNESVNQRGFGKKSARLLNRLIRL